MQTTNWENQTIILPSYDANEPHNDLYGKMGIEML